MRSSVCLVTLGCAKNEADSARLATLLARRFTLVDDPARAAAVVVNTCGFIEDAVSESLDTLLELADSAGSPLVVAAGCLVSRYGDEFSRALPEAGLAVPLGDLHRIDELVEIALARDRATGTRAGAGGLRPSAVDAPASRPPAPARALWSVAPTVFGPTAYLTISDGCRRTCSFCTIPSIRGGFVSRPPRDVVAEAEALVSGGAKEVVLVGQDTASYGRDLPADGGVRWSLARLIRRLAERVGERAWIRVLYLQPDSLDEELLQAMAEGRGVCGYLDVPVQHADPGVLAAMRRSGSEQDIRGMVDRVREAMPDATLRTTVMVGFPGETARAFDRLRRLVGEGLFDYVGVFAYSREEGTPAAELPDQVRADVKRRRRDTLVAEADASWARTAAGLVGRELTVLVEGPADEPGFDWVGRSQGQAPGVDGVVYWTGPRPGPFAQVLVESAVGYDLLGVAVA